MGMAELHCTNCGNPASDTYNLLLRCRSHAEVPLCDPCHEAIQAEIQAGA